MFTFCIVTLAGIAQSVWRLATGWTVWKSNPGGEREFQHPSRPALGSTQPAIQGVLAHSLGIQRWGLGVDYTPSSAEVKEKVEIFLDSPSGPT
jgi:hypothetical protein